MTEDDDLATIIGSRIVALRADGDGSLYLAFDTGQVLTFEGDVEIYLTKHTVQ